MRKLLLLMLFAVFATGTAYAQPTLDGTFDGTGTWGTAVSENATAGWSDANAQKLYIAHDQNYIYFGAEVTVANWMSYGFLINTTTGGGTTEPYGHQITFGHSNLPDYVIRGGFTGNTGYDDQLVTWNGSAWSYGGGFASSEYGESESFVEVRIARASLGSPTSIDVQFYVTGNNSGEHGSFNAVPADNDATGWNMSGSPTSLTNYATSIDVTPAAVPDQVTLNTPADAATDVALQPTLSWNSVTGATSYNVQVSTANDFTSTAYDSTGITGTSFAVPANLLSNTTYYWRVRAANAEGNGLFSETRSFTTLFVSTINAINLSSPADAATSQSLLPAFSWVADGEATSYQIQVSATNDFTTTVADNSGEGTTYTATTQLDFNTTYYWRVRGINAQGNGPWSATRSFTSLTGVTFEGNGGTGFGGVISGGNLIIGEDDTRYFFKFTKSGGDFNDFMVLYFSTGAAGRSVIDGDVNDQADNNRRAISNAGENASTLTFHSGFAATHAVSIGTAFGGLWAIPAEGTIGDNGLTFGTAVGQPANASDASFTFNFEKSQLGSPASFNFVGTYLNGGNGFTSNEGFGFGFPTDNIGANAFTFRGYQSYPSGNATVAQELTGAAGWRFMSSPVSNGTYSDLFGNIWTQGIASGANTTDGSPNILTYDGAAFQGVSDLSATVPAARGILTYVYADDNPSTSEVDGGFPKVLDVTGTLNAGSVNATVTAGGNAWSLVGNPYERPVDWDDLTKTDLTGVVYVYDHAYTTPDSENGDQAAADQGGSYRVWNGTTGSLTNGLIAPLQGFWIQNVATPAGTPGLTFENADKSNGGSFYKEAEEAITIELGARMDALYSSAFFSFQDNADLGLDPLDGLKLSPLDRKAYVSLATVVGETPLDIQNLPRTLESAVEVPLSVQAWTPTEDGWMGKSGEVTITWPALTNIPESWSVQLVDQNEGMTIDLLTETSYTFMLDAPLGKVKPIEDTFTPTNELADMSGRFKVVVGPITTSNESYDVLPSTIALEQNFPNPFNPSTNINFSLPEAMEVRVSIFDMLGREIAVLVDGGMSAGNHQTIWNAASQASGIYYYRLQAGQTVITKKMTLIK